MASGLIASWCIAGCGGSGNGGDRTASGAGGHAPATHADTLDATKVEQAIASSARSQRRAAATVNCPTGIPLKAGTRFYCVAEVGARDTPFLVTEHGTKGDVTYQGLQPGQAPTLYGPGIATAIRRTIERARHVTERVSCPTGIPRQRGLQFVCVATGSHGASTQFLVRETSRLGAVRYRER